MADGLGLGVAIVSTLRRYGKVPIFFLVSMLHSETREIEVYLNELQAKGLVERDGDQVQLTPLAMRGERPIG